MDKSELQTLLRGGLSIREIAKKKQLAYGTIRYWLEQYDLVTGYTSRLGKYICVTCHTTDRNKFYGHRKNTCKQCFNIQVRDKRLATRNKIISHMGGECRICGFNKYSCSLDVHHTDQSKKDVYFDGHLRSWSWGRILKEITHCVLLCKNCHSAVHNGLIMLP